LQPVEYPDQRDRYKYNALGNRWELQNIGGQDEQGSAAWLPAPTITSRSRSPHMLQFG